MFDGMSMPVLFGILIAALALISAGVLVGIRILAAHDNPSGPHPSRRAKANRAARADHD